MHYRCVVYGKRSMTKNHVPDLAVLGADKRFVKWANRILGDD